MRPKYFWKELEDSDKYNEVKKYSKSRKNVG